MGLFDTVKRVRSRAGLLRVSPKIINQQRFVPGPDPAPGLQAAEWRGPQYAAPSLPISPMLTLGGVAQPEAGFDDLQWQAVLPNNNGVGATVNALTTVEQIPVRQWASAITSPTKQYDNPRNPTRGVGGHLREVMQNLVSPPRLQNVPGYTITQDWTAASQVNAQQQLMYQSLYANPANASQNGMC